MKDETRMNTRNKNNGDQPESKRVHFEFASPTAECLALARRTRYSRFPLCEGGNLDKIHLT